jgi:hypothetical protein
MLVWEAVDRGWAAGRFEVRPAQPEGWDLYASGRHRGHYRRASIARATAVRLDRIRSRRVGIALRSGAALAVVGLIALGLVFRMEANPDRAAAEVLTGRMDAAYQSVRAGTPIASVDAPGFAAEVVPLPTGGEVNMLTGAAGGECYSFYWNDTRGPVARVLVGSLPCEPSPSSVQSGHNVYHRQTPVVAGHLVVPGGTGFDWEGVLPPVERQRPWIIPMLIGLGAVVLSLVVGATRVALR